MYLYTYTHTYSTPKNIQTPIQGDCGCYETHSTLPFTRLGTARSRSTRIRYTSILRSMHRRHSEAPPPLLGTAEEGRRKGKGSEAGHELKPPGERVTCICYFFLKNEVEKILEIL